MGRLRLGSVVWLGMVLAGSCLGAFVFAAWPEQTTYMSRQPHGEARPKTPSVADDRQAPVERVVASAGAAVEPEAAAAEESVERELAGPPPVPSESETDGYRAETPEELGAKPLPGMNPSVPAPLGEPAPVATTS